ncbi:FtsK/SpoIIIE domain-containing protein [Paratractidigestivibacter sp.]|uniref:FtsK/SpoIIIE domain-containing protein n=1 Tax=Paratractidigestivibacter sp. TaxID=2847316 RepID=UPI002ACB160A|nr:FtsK/SpoIIIE domain-containing protein [Paratractidigestivibacter sp.]
MLYSSDASPIVHAAPGVKVLALGAALFSGGCLFAGLGRLIEQISIQALGSSDDVAWLVHAFGRYGLLCGAVGMSLLIASLVIALKTTPASKLRYRVSQGLYDPRFGNPLSLADGEMLPRLRCDELGPGTFELTVSALSSTVDAVAELGPAISSRLSGPFRDYAVTRTTSDDAQNRVTFRIEDVTVDRQLVVDDVAGLTPDEPYLLAVQEGLSLDLTTSGSILVAGKTRSGKTTGVLSLLLQVLDRGPDGHGSQVLVIDPKQAELSRAPHVVTLDESGEARAILAAVRAFADAIAERQALLNDLSVEKGDAVHWWEAGLKPSFMFIDEYVALRTVLPARASSEKPDYSVKAFDDVLKRIVTMGASAGCYAIISIAEASVGEGGLPAMLRNACSTRVLFRPTDTEARLMWDAAVLGDAPSHRQYSPGEAWLTSTDGEHEAITVVKFPLLRFRPYGELARLLDVYYG